MASTTMRRALGLKLDLVDGKPVVRDFGYFIDTHRDLPHIGSFEDDLHRGFCKPTLVHFVPERIPGGGVGELIRASDGKRLVLHPKHQFVTESWFKSFVLQQTLTTGRSPLDANGHMATSHLRDPRKRVYALRSFRQMVMYHYLKPAAKASAA